MAMNYDIACEDPRLIINPKIVDIALHCDHYYLDGVRYSIDDDMRFRLADGDSPSKVLRLPFVPTYVEFVDSFKYGKIIKSKCNRVIFGHDSFLDNSYFVSPDGEIDYIYTFVPCSKCNVCCSKKMSSYVQRCQFALQESGSEGFTCTLQYNDDHLPEFGALDIRDIQLFQKKLKVTVSRLWHLYAPKISDWELFDCLPLSNQISIISSISSCKRYWQSVSRSIKFIYSGEYGSDHGRPHWHLLIFGLPVFRSFSGQWNVAFDEIMRHHVIQYAWRDAVRKDNGLFESFSEYRLKYPKVFQVPKGYDPYSKGYIYVKEIESSKAVSYALKYAFKHFSDDSSSIYGCSNNLGVEFVRSKFDEVFSSPDYTLSFRSMISGSVSKVNLCSYYIKKFLPSISDLIPVNVRKAFRSVVTVGSKLLSEKYLSLQVRHFVHKVFDFVFDKYSFLNFSFCCNYSRSFGKFDFNLDYRSSVDQDGLTFIMPKRVISSSALARVHSENLQSFQFFESCYKTLLDFDFDPGSILSSINRRNLYFSKLKKRSRSEVLVSGIDYSELMKHYNSISTL